jgi:hypothetical protein
VYVFGLWFLLGKIMPGRLSKAQRERIDASLREMFRAVCDAPAPERLIAFASPKALETGGSETDRKVLASRV